MKRTRGTTRKVLASRAIFFKPPAPRSRRSNAIPKLTSSSTERCDGRFFGEKRTSPIHGRGLFARTTISAGEVVAVKGGAIMDAASLALIRDQVSPAEIQIEDDLYIAPRIA